MVGYTTIGVKDLDAAIAFYSKLLGEFGGKELFNTGRLVMFGKEMGKGMLGICLPFDGKPPSPGNGTMVALSMESRDDVDKLHALALSLGASDEGPVGDRMPGFYAGYFRDPDGNKFCAYYMG